MIDYSKPVLNKNGQPLKIGMLGHHFCIRIIKRSRALKRLGYSLIGCGNKVSYGTDLFDTYSVFHDEKQFKNTIKTMIAQGVDIFDYSNEPSEPAIWTKEVLNEMGVSIPLVVDLHDLDGVRRGFIPIPEREMINAADGLIYVSLPILQKMNKLHAIIKPTIALHSYCNEGIVEYDEALIPNRHGMVYEGGANSPEDNELNQAFAYRSLYHIIKKLVDMGNEVHMFCGNFDAFQNYQNLGAALYPPTDYDEMMKRMTEFKYGILVFNNKENTEAQVRWTFANKFSEYTQAGLPSLACWCEYSESLVKRHGIGFTFSDIEEISNTSQFEDKYLEVMSNIKLKRKELVMENQIWKLEKLYANLLGVESKGIPDNIKQMNEYDYDKEDVETTLSL